MGKPRTILVPGLVQEGDEVCIHVQLVAEDGTAAWIASGGATTDEAIDRAEEHAREVFEEEWNYRDWEAI